MGIVVDHDDKGDWQEVDYEELQGCRLSDDRSHQSSLRETRKSALARNEVDIGTKV